MVQVVVRFAIVNSWTVALNSLHLITMHCEAHWDKVCWRERDTFVACGEPGNVDINNTIIHSVLSRIGLMVSQQNHVYNLAEA